MAIKEGLSGLYHRLPTNMRLLGEYLAGVDAPITAKDFKPEELEFIRQQVIQQQQQNRAQEQELKDRADSLQRLIRPKQPQKTSGVRLANPEKVLQEVLSDLSTYDTTRGTTAITDPYKQGQEVVDQGYLSALGKSFIDPQYNVATSLGKYVATDEGNGMRIKDSYDFNPEERNLPGGLAALRNMRHSPELLFEYLANYLGRTPRAVDLYLASED